MSVFDDAEKAMAMADDAIENASFGDLLSAALPVIAKGLTDTDVDEEYNFWMARAAEVVKGFAP